MTKVFILATCRREDLLPFTLLVFKTLRIGFPTAEVHVHANGTDGSDIWGQPLKDATEAAGAKLYLKEETTHHDWIEKLIEAEKDDFWICDTDMIFYGSVESWKFEDSLAGALIPEFCDQFTNAITRSRLHTSLLHIRPLELKVQLLKYETRHPLTIYNPPANLVHPLYLPFNGRTYFYDTMAMAYHAVGGREFSVQQKNAYFHFHFGTFSDMVLPKLKGAQEMAIMRQAIMRDPQLGIGAWRIQDEYFAAQQFSENGTDVIAPIVPKDGEEAHKWNVELCRGNQAAMIFCDRWYHYCHGIDDLIDTLRDGRPRMSKDQIVGLFKAACLLYNTDFFVQNRELLAPIIILVTNTYQDSIAWEHSSKPHLRAMADVFRTCGNEIYAMVALICGGEAHMRAMSMAIKERDWLGQHDEAGNPT